MFFINLRMHQEQFTVFVVVIPVMIIFPILLKELADNSIEFRFNHTNINGLGVKSNSGLVKFFWPEETTELFVFAEFSYKMFTKVLVTFVIFILGDKCICKNIIPFHGSNKL